MSVASGLLHAPPAHPQQRCTVGHRSGSRLNYAAASHSRGRGSTAPRAAADDSAQPYQIPPPPGMQNAEVVEYTDSATDLAFIGMCRRAYGDLAGWQSDAGWDSGPETYRGMIAVSRALMQVGDHARASGFNMHFIGARTVTNAMHCCRFRAKQQRSSGRR